MSIHSATPGGVSDATGTQSNGYYYFVEPAGSIQSTGSTVNVTSTLNLSNNGCPCSVSAITGASNVTGSITGVDLWNGYTGVATTAGLVSQVPGSPNSGFLHSFGLRAHAPFILTAGMHHRPSVECSRRDE